MCCCGDLGAILETMRVCRNEFFFLLICVSIAWFYVLIVEQMNACRREVVTFFVFFSRVFFFLCFLSRVLSFDGRTRFVHSFLSTFFCHKGQQAVHCFRC